MTYPTVTKLEAKRVVRLRRDGQDAKASVVMKRLGSELDWEELVAPLHARFSAIRQGMPDAEAGRGRTFEIEAGQALHEALPAHAALADPEFWIWLAVSEFPDTVVWRYGDDGDSANFGTGGAQENFLYRLWLRADIGFEPGTSEPYGLARLGDIDFWRSHLFRQDYAVGREFARAFIRFQFPEESDGKARLKVKEIRALASRLKKARSNLMVEVMEELRASKFIETEWAKLSAE